LILNHPFFHFRPRRVPGAAIRFKQTFGLGGAALILLILLFASGLLLRLVYDPFPVKAYDSIVLFQNRLLFGRFIRNIHCWSANFLIAVVFLHLLRVVFTAGFFPPRHLNWYFGLLLWFTCLASSFTGYLLPWDQLAYWAVTICTGMLGTLPLVGEWLQEVFRGGDQIGAVTLRIFYTFHTALLPALMLLLCGLHFWYIRKAGGIVFPRGLEETNGARGRTAISGQDLLRRELMVSLVVIAAVFLVSALVDAPLGDRANPGMSPNPAKAPWYFAGIQELLLLFHPILAILVIPALASAALIWLPFHSIAPGHIGIWFRSLKGRKLSLLSLVLSLLLTSAGILHLDSIATTKTVSPDLAEILTSSVLPFVLGVIGLVGYYLVLKRWLKAETDEAILAIITFLLVTYLVLSVSGIWFRGEGMALVQP